MWTYIRHTKPHNVWVEALLSVGVLFHINYTLILMSLVQSLHLQHLHNHYQCTHTFTALALPYLLYSYDHWTHILIKSLHLPFNAFSHLISLHFNTSCRRTSNELALTKSLSSHTYNTYIIMYTPKHSTLKYTSVNFKALKIQTFNCYHIYQ